MGSYPHFGQTVKARFDQLREETQAGMTTAEYAVGTLAACPQHTSPS
jgi:hypothetical protein